MIALNGHSEQDLVYIDLPSSRVQCEWNAVGTKVDSRLESCSIDCQRFGLKPPVQEKLDFLLATLIFWLFELSF